MNCGMNLEAPGNNVIKYFLLLLLFFQAASSFAQVRCGTTEYEKARLTKHPNTETTEAFEKWMASKLARSKTADIAGRSEDVTYTIPVVIHILHNGEAVGAGMAMAFARSVGEYGSVIFIAGNMPLKSEITPLLIMTKLEQYDYAGATALGVVMLVVSFLLALMINLVQWWSGTRHTAR